MTNIFAFGSFKGELSVHSRTSGLSSVWSTGLPVRGTGLPVRHQNAWKTHWRVTVSRPGFWDPVSEGIRRANPFLVIN